MDDEERSSEGAQYRLSFFPGFHSLYMPCRDGQLELVSGLGGFSRHAVLQNKPHPVYLHSLAHDGDDA